MAGLKSCRKHFLLQSLSSSIWLEARNGWNSLLRLSGNTETHLPSTIWGQKWINPQHFQSLIICHYFVGKLSKLESLLNFQADVKFFLLQMCIHQVTDDITLEMPGADTLIQFNSNFQILHIVYFMLLIEV